ncbi:MAG: hypothetical protein [Microviridae sp.]|nr:MAG: hypothetical protein [Microviridae sp.]
MYKKPVYYRTSLIGKTIEGETIEDKVNRLINDKEPIKDGAPLIFTERSQGVGAGYNIRTDRWEIAVEAMDRVIKMKNAKKEDIAKVPEKKEEGKEAKVIDMKDGKAESPHSKAQNE